MKRKQQNPSWQVGAPQHKPTICFAAGHSGGHIIPCLTLAERDYAAHNILFFTSNKQLDCDLVARNNRSIMHVPLSITQTRKWYMFPALIVSLAWATLHSFAQLIVHMPTRIITTGSIVALPVCIAGWILGIPIELFELNAHPGKTIVGLSYISHTVRYCFVSARSFFSRNHCIATPYPIQFARPSPLRPMPRFTPNRITLFVQGGSQGSHEINQLMQDFIESDPKLHQHIQIIHQTGSHTNAIRDIYENAQIPAHVFAFEDDLSAYYQAANLIICRAGAGALFEALHFQKNTLIVPLITPTNDHQLHNARAMAQEYPELFEVIESKNAAQIVHTTIHLKAKRYANNFVDDTISL